MATIRRRSTDIGSIKVEGELGKVLAELRKQHGDRTVVPGSTARQPWRIPTGIFEFDYATLGGILHDRINMVHGPKHSGKSYISDRIIMGAQQTMPDSSVVKIDVEGTHDAVWSGKTGVDNDALLLVHPDTGEQAVDITRAFVHTKEVSLVVVDSLAALFPMKEQDADADKELVGVQSKLITRMLRAISAAQITERKRGHHVTVLLINQQRSKIGGWSPTGDPISLPGGKALGHFTSLEWRMRNKENITKDAQGRETLSHNDHAFTIEKNKCVAGTRSGDFRMIRRDAPELGLEEAEIDDGPAMLSYAKMEGWYTGTPKQGYVLSFGEYNHHAAKADDMVKALYEDREFYWALRCHLIAENARRQKMPEAFVNYILTGEASDE